MYQQDLILVLPLMFLLFVGLFLMLLDAFKVRRELPMIAALGLLGSMGLSFFSVASEGFGKQTLQVFSGMYLAGGLPDMVNIILCTSALFTLFFLGEWMKRKNQEIPDIYTLLIFSVVGMMLLANANDLIMTFIGLETMSVCLYIMAALFKRDTGSNEAGLKYFLLGAFSAAFLLFGIALIYGVTGSTRYDMINLGVFIDNPMTMPAIGLLLIGFLFKISAFPFQFWTPDVYQGTPTPLAGFMATGSKAAAFVAFGSMIRSMGVLPDKVMYLIGISAVATMVYGNFVAARQSNLKRMLAYSSIAHSGYVLLGLLGGFEGYKSAMFYMLVYTLMNVGAFGMISMVETKAEDTDASTWKGLGMKNPWFGIMLSIFLFSMAGIPPLAGFMSKYSVFMAAIHSGHVLLATLGILTSVVGAYYYINVIVGMFFGKNEEPAVVATTNIWPKAGIWILAILIIILGIYPSFITEPINNLAAFTQMLSAGH